MIRLVKAFFDFIAYISAGLFGFILAFVLAVQFLPSASSETQKDLGLKKIINSGQGIVKKLTNKKDQEPESNGKALPAPDLALPPNDGKPKPQTPDLALPPSEEASGTSGTPQAPVNSVSPDLALPPNNGKPSSSQALPKSEPALPPGEIPATADVATPPSPKGESNEVINVPNELKTTEAGSTSLNQPEADAVSQGLAEIRSYMAPYIYDPSNRTDPFDDPTTIAPVTPPGNQLSPIIEVIRTPPEEHSLSEIQLKGIIWDIKNPKALFKLPFHNSYYTLSRGSRIGENGIIFEIREDEVVILEKFNQIDADGSVAQNIKILRLDRLNL